MMDKRIIPESFDLGVDPVEIIGASRATGMDKTAMLKRGSAFADVLDGIRPERGRTLLHVITTGAMERYGANRNGDAFNEDAMDYTAPEPERGMPATIRLDGGLRKYHDSSYMSKSAAVYQEHHSDEEPSGRIVAARYNGDMHRGELIISVDDEKWGPRLHKKASGQDIYLSMGCRVSHDTCSRCLRQAKVASEHCDHFKRHRGELGDDGVRNFVINDAPHFYDISGVDVPADRIAYVLRKVASEEGAAPTLGEARGMLGFRRGMSTYPAARLLAKLAAMEKRVEGAMTELGCDLGEDHDEEAADLLVRRVGHYPADEVIDCCSRHGVLLTPGMLFRVMANDLEDGAGLEDCDDGCCGDCSGLMRELERSEDVDDCLRDGSFDGRFLPDAMLESIVRDAIPELGMRPSDVGRRVVTVTIVAAPSRMRKRAAAMPAPVEEALRRTYARYLVSFAAQNDDATCMQALRKLASLGRR